MVMQHIFPGLDLCYTDPAQPLILAADQALSDVFVGDIFVDDLSVDDL